MSRLRTLGHILTTIVSFLGTVVNFLAHGLLSLVRGLLIFIPMLLLDLMLFMFFQVNLTMEQADVLGLVLLSFIGGWALGMMMRSRVDAFWKK